MSSKSIQLRPYQVKLVDGCREALRTRKRVIAYLPTAGGKTAVSVGMIQAATDKGSKVAFVCNRNQLIAQTSRTFDRYGIQHGIIQGENTRDPFSNVVVCSIQTLAKRGFPEDIRLLIIDECHGASGTKAYHDIMKGRYVIGLTATPYQGGLGRDIQSLGGAIFEHVVVGADMRDLIRDGFLVGADVYAPADPDLTGVKTVAGDYHEEQLGKAMDKAQLVGDIISNWHRLANGTRTMVFATSIAHSRHICQEFLASGVMAEHVDYHMSQDEKEAIYSRFQLGETMVLCNCALLSEGADFPACETLVLARPTKSRVRYVQMFGRVLRPFPGKTIAKVLDHSGTVLRLGLPWHFSVTHLDDGKVNKSKSNTDKKEKPEPKPKKCPKCDFVKDAGVRECPSCGHTPEHAESPEVIPGDLVPLTKGAKSPAQRSLQSMGRSSIYGQLCQVAKDRGKSEKWIIANYKGIFDQWPRQDYHCETPTPELLSWLRHKQIAWANSRARK